MNWNQTGMPSVLLGQRREIAEFKSVLRDAQNQIMCPADAESMAKELVKSGGREFVNMVRELTTALANARRELEDANRRYERLAADLRQRGIGIPEDPCPQQKPDGLSAAPTSDVTPGETRSPKAELAEWEDWNRRFQSLLE